MRPPRFRLRALMLAVGFAALLLWGGMLARRSIDYSRRADEFAEQERRWREIAARNRSWASWGPKIADYYAPLAEKYRRAAWRPWSAVEPDPSAPGYEEYRASRGR